MTPQYVMHAPVSVLMAMSPPSHEHALRVDDLTADGQVYLHPSDAERLAPHCAGCAYQVRADRYAAERQARIARELRAVR